MSDIPTDLKYIETHQWVRVSDDGTATVGITDFARSNWVMWFTLVCPILA